MHRLLYRQGLTLDAARAGIDALATETPEAAAQRIGQPAQALVHHRGVAPLARLIGRDAQHVLRAGNRPFQVARLQPAQLDVEFLSQLRTLNILPGANIQLEFRDAGVLVMPAGKKDGLELTNDLAKHLFVES